MKRKKLDSIIKNILKEQYIKEEFNIKEVIEYDPEHSERMNPDIERRLRSGEHIFGKSKSLPLGDLHNYSEKLASKRFKDIINKVKRYHGINNIDSRLMSQMMRLLKDISIIETIHKDALEQLAIDIVSEEFDVPESMLEAELVPPGTNISMDDDEDDDDDDDGEEYEIPKQPKSAKRMEELELEVDKRNVINALMQGAAKKGHYIFHMVADELDSIDPTLMGLYGRLMSLADLNYWTIPDSMLTGTVGGKEKIKWKKPEKEDEDELEEMGLEDEEKVPVVEAKAWIFPVLVHELIKGVLELAATNWGDNHLDFEEQKQVIKKSDTLENELWGMRLGPGMWEKFLNCIPPEDYDIKQWLFRELSKLPALQFHEFMKEIISGSQRCGEIIETLKELHYEDENESLEDMLDDTGYDDMGDVLDHLDDEDEDEDDFKERSMYKPYYGDEEDGGEVDYSNMSKREIQDLINDALDDGNFDLIRKLKDYL